MKNAKNPFVIHKGIGPGKSKILPPIQGRSPPAFGRRQDLGLLGRPKEPKNAPKNFPLRGSSIPLTRGLGGIFGKFFEKKCKKKTIF